ncbi:helix-turn-helix domain-containing protein [Synechococcus sp. CBW1107]|uniref:helix-turn-helix domain-containing protein n=2 Tax=unclassified Synechococcus TaxID=2626047 RepID=UPI002AD232B6|nr:helix-turn-helix domain-containing protein [Synechococcus sp. CBW1107]CAK6699614.1 hypothetical protein ICNINCKA_02677 [Synechococcus sp. CBW1107]
MAEKLLAYCWGINQAMVSLAQRQLRRQLKQDSGSVGDLAEKLGYNSEAAFNRAFKKTIGLTPGAVRRGMTP